jgi:hypothetical protein
MLFQQITGQPSVLYYAASIFQQAGFAGAEEATRVSLILGFFKLVMTGGWVGGWVCFWLFLRGQDERIASICVQRVCGG